MGKKRTDKGRVIDDAFRQEAVDDVRYLSHN
jgi:hypothetical protein